MTKKYNTSVLLERDLGKDLSLVNWLVCTIFRPRKVCLRSRDMVNRSLKNARTPVVWSIDISGGVSRYAGGECFHAPVQPQLQQPSQGVRVTGGWRLAAGVLDLLLAAAFYDRGIFFLGRFFGGHSQKRLYTPQTIPAKIHHLRRDPFFFFYRSTCFGRRCATELNLTCDNNKKHIHTYIYIYIYMYMCIYKLRKMWLYRTIFTRNCKNNSQNNNYNFQLQLQLQLDHDNRVFANKNKNWVKNWISSCTTHSELQVTEPPVHLLQLRDTKRIN